MFRITTVMMEPITYNANMMVEIAVDQMSILTIVRYVFVMKIVKHL